MNHATELYAIKRIRELIEYSMLFVQCLLRLTISLTQCRFTHPRADNPLTDVACGTYKSSPRCITWGHTVDQGCVEVLNVLDSNTKQLRHIGLGRLQMCM